MLEALIFFFTPWVLWIYMLFRARKLKKRNKELEAKLAATPTEVADTHAEAEKILAEANEKLRLLQERERGIRERQADAENEAVKIVDRAQAQAQEIQQKADMEYLKAREKAQEAIAQAEKEAKFYENLVKAMKNIIEGYGNDYIIPSRTLLDDLADTYGYTQASEEYKRLRARIREMVKNGSAADCDYAEEFRRQTAINFVTDAFNGKADTILASAKADNFGTLKQKLIDAYNIVNANGKAFRNARITEAYFNLRMEELRQACLITEIHKRDVDEQRRIKEQMREEEKARRELEKALRDSAKEEEMLQKAMEKARAQLEQASAEQRAIYESQIAELERKCKEAEERNQRAKSMAEQTRSGHVYIISNVGSFGENVLKIGMTRRLEPLDRIKELSNASVPFAFDVHAMIWSQDAPALETQLHKKFALAQMNKANSHKEFFRVPLSEIREELEKDNLEIKWTMAAEAAEYRETLAIEEAIKNDPQARDAWLNRELDSTISLFVEDEEEESA